jgi:uncharacterized membrane protein YbhN (UPF0104 family)
MMETDHTIIASEARVRGGGLLLWAKVALSLALLLSLAHIVDWKRAADALAHAALLPLLFAPCVAFLGLFVAALRWSRVLANGGVRLNWPHAFRGYVIGTFYGALLPGSMSGDLLRLGYCARTTGCSAGLAAAGVLVERISGVLALVLMVLGAAFFVPSMSQALFHLGMGQMSIALGVALMAILAAVRWGPRLLLLGLPEGTLGRVGASLRAGAEGMRALGARALLELLLISAVFQTADICATLFLSKALSMNLPAAIFFAVLPLAYLVSALPISIGGAGVREGTLVLLLTRFGVGASDAATLAFLVLLNRQAVAVLAGFTEYAFFSRK